jgi:ABC-type oligopeptide transport system substrate-binding subunit
MLQDRTGDVILSAWPGRTDLTTNYALLLAKESFYNAGKVTPVANIEELLDATRKPGDAADRVAAFHAMMRAERQGALIAPLCYEPVVYAFRNNVKGFAPTLLGKPKLDGVYFEA